MGKVVVYVRVSDQRQADGTSLATQEQICREWATANGHSVDRVFVEEGESAKSADRPEFQRLFSYIKSYKRGTFTHVLVYRFDRFSRNVEDGSIFRVQLREQGTSLRSATELTDDTPSGRFTSTILQAVSQLDNDVRAERTVTGMKARAASGRWVWPAPTGYRAGARSEESLVADDRGPLIAKLFELVSKGETKASALAKVTALGLRSVGGNPLSQETLRKLMLNPLYMGRIVIPRWGIDVVGDWKPLVTETMFQKVQSVLAGRAPVARRKARASEAEFPLRGLLNCTVCGLPVTASRSRGKSGQHFRYYRCHRASGHLNVRAETVEQEFLILLESLVPTPERLALVEHIFRDIWAERKGTANVEADTLKWELRKLETRAARSLSLVADGAIGQDEYKRLRAETESSLSDLRSRLFVLESSELDLNTALSYLSHLFWNTALVWENSDLAEKQRLQTRIFPKGITWAENGFGTPVLSPIHILCSNLGDHADCEVELVAPQGFEPRLIGSEPTVLPLNEGAILQGMVPRCGSAGVGRRLPS